MGDTHASKCALAAEILRSSGRLRLRVMGWSMLPAVWPGDTLLIERVDSGAVSEGDIVLFGRERRFFAHRVVTRNGRPGNSQILTRGDAMLQPDPPLSDSEVLGKVVCIVRRGKCLEPSKTPRLPGRAVAALVRRSEIATRVVVGVHGWRQSSQN
jgi:signal peptidase I